MPRGAAFSARLQAWNTSSNAAATGEAENITAYLIRDGVAVAAAGAITEPDATHCPGEYALAVSGDEADCSIISAAGVCSTSNVAVFGATYSLASPGIISVSVSDPSASTDTGTLQVYRGDEQDIAFTITNGDGDPYPWTSVASVELTVKAAAYLDDDDDDNAAIGPDTLAAGAAGAVTWSMAAADTEDLDPDTSYWYDIRITTDEGDVITAVCAPFRVLRNVMRGE